jgi:hypothetical protein
MGVRPGRRTTLTHRMTPVSNGTRAVDELAMMLRPLGLGISRRLPEIIVGIALLVALLAAFALAGAAVDDSKIAKNPATAEAKVLEGSTFARTLVQFTVANGETVIPENGVFYPRGVEAGTNIAVEYDVTKPELVRVAGRTALSGLPTMSLGVLGTWVVLGPLAFWLHRRRNRR